MKQRNGCVSNSSSQSFILGTKGVPTEAAIVQQFQIEPWNKLYPVAKGIAEIVVHSVETVLRTLEEGMQYAHENEWSQEY